MRPVVSYDDITAPQNGSSKQLGPLPPSANQPPAKKRRISQHKASQKRVAQQHWDDPGNGADAMTYGEDDSAYAAEEMEYEEEEEESRDLTHDEIWDDSALIEAWNSATAEYEAYHGKNKDWKKAPVKKSPLWYNVPPEKKAKAAGKTTSAAPPSGTVNGTTEEDSTPIDFDTYTPTHDPSLAEAAPPAAQGPDSSQFAIPLASGSSVGADEAFQKALSATYWAGYWTAVYHCQNKQGSQQSTDVEEHAAQSDGAEDGGEDDSADLLTTQR